MSFRYRSKRNNLAYEVAAHYFNAFADPRSRGAKWTPGIMPDMVKREAEFQAKMACVPARYVSEVGETAKTFYEQYFDSVMYRL